MNDSPLIEARDLHKVYSLGKRKLEVLKGVSLSVRAGEFLALKGASGAGKSTLLHLLAGLDAPTSGDIFFGGQRLRSMSGSDLARLRNSQIGYVFQAYHLFPELDALENVCLPARISRRSSGPVEKKGRELLARTGLKDRMDHKPYELSGGEQQRVAIARALINDPKLIVADEPTGNLDSHSGDEIIELLLALRVERDATLIIATHDAEVAKRAPRLLTLMDGAMAPEEKQDYGAV